MIRDNKNPNFSKYKEEGHENGKILIFEYPRQTPGGEQMDFVEVMEIKDALIQYHRFIGMACFQSHRRR